MGYTASVFICPFVNVIDKAEMPGFCVFFWRSRVLQQNKRRYFHKHCADVRHAWDLAASSLMQEGAHVSHYGFVMALKADLCHLTNKGNLSVITCYLTRVVGYNKPDFWTPLHCVYSHCSQYAIVCFLWKYI